MCSGNICCFIFTLASVTYGLLLAEIHWSLEKYFKNTMFDVLVVTVAVFLHTVCRSSCGGVCSGDSFAGEIYAAATGLRRLWVSL